MTVQYNSPIDFRIPQVPPPGSDPKVYVILKPLYDFANQVIQALCQYCGIGPRIVQDWPLLAGSTTTLLSGNLRRFYVTAGENIAESAIISLYSNAGTIGARNANATGATKLADGFCSTVGGITNGQIGEVILSTGVLTGTGFTVGAPYWLDTANGAITLTPPASAGNVEQYIGKAITTSQLYVNISGPIRH